jgi:hypothetical protein
VKKKLLLLGGMDEERGVDRKWVTMMRDVMQATPHGTVPGVKIITIGSSDLEQSVAWKLVGQFMRRANGKRAFHSGGNLPSKSVQNESQ